MNIPATRMGHVGHAKRCLGGLGAKAVEHDANRILIAFYCLSILDLLSEQGIVGDENLGMKTQELDGWREWVWSQYSQGGWGAGFADSSYTAEAPSLIITYAALISLAILRDDFSRLDKTAVLKFLRSCQRLDGAFTANPRSSILPASSYLIEKEEETEADVRMAYCAFAISSMLGGFGSESLKEEESVDVSKAVEWVRACRTYEGAYGQTPRQEGHGGPTYCAIASLHIASQPLTGREREETLRWLTWNQLFTPYDVTDGSITSEEVEGNVPPTGDGHQGGSDRDIMMGGFRGRTNKEADACYSFWCCAAVKILGGDGVIDVAANERWIERCTFRWGGVAKSIGEVSDPYHTYLGLASLAIFPVSPCDSETRGKILRGPFEMPEVDVVINGRLETVRWIKERIRDGDA